MRERYLEVFDSITVDCLNGDKYKTGKLTPEGEPDPSIFSTEFNREGIQVGTAIATLVCKGQRDESPNSESQPQVSPPSPRTNEISFRHLWGKNKRNVLIETFKQPGPNPDIS